jgi:hypothetical protein
MKNYIVHFVIRSNRIWPFSIVNRWPYYIALAVIKIVCQRFQEISGLYLRHGMSEKNWVPGISDIDLTVTISPHLSIEQRYRFLQKFWNVYPKVQKILPMLGEVAIISQQDLPQWTKFGIHGYQARNWKTVFGETVDSLYFTQNRLQEDAFCKAATYYTLQCLPRFFSSLEDDLIKRERMRRLLSRIQKFSYFTREYNEIKGESLDTNQLLSQILDVLEKGVRNTNASFTPEPLPHNEKADEFSWILKPLDCLKAHIVSITILKREVYIVLRGDLKKEIVARLFATLRSTLVNGPYRPIVVTPHLFNYICSYYYPHRYDVFKEHRNVIFGRDLFLWFEPPSLSATKQYWLRGFSQIALFPHRERFFCGKSRDEYLLLLKKNLTLIILLSENRLSTEKQLLERFPEKFAFIESIEKYSLYEQYQFFCSMSDNLLSLAKKHEPA